MPMEKVIVNYITKDNDILSDSIEINGLVGSNYETLKKEFDKYGLIEVIGEVKGKIKEDIIEVTYIYDLTLLPPHTGVNKSSYNNYINNSLYFILALGIIKVLKK